MGRHYRENTHSWADLPPPTTMALPGFESVMGLTADSSSSMFLRRCAEWKTGPVKPASLAALSDSVVGICGSLQPYVRNCQ